MNTSTSAVIHALKEIEELGIETSPRGIKVRELRDYIFDINPLSPIPHFDSRPANFRYTAGEFAWYLKGEKSISFIQKFSKFWDRVADSNKNINSNYGNLIIYNPQFKWAYDSLVKDKDTRQAIMFFNNPQYQYEDNKDFVCTMYVNFSIRNNILDMKTNMRSQDIFYGFSYDVPWFSLVMQNMHLLLKDTYPELELGTYKHSCDNLHYYERHFDIAKKVVAQDGYTSYSMILKEPLFYIDGNDTILTNSAKKFISDVESNSEEIYQEYWVDLLSTIFEIKEQRGIF